MPETLLLLQSSSGNMSVGFAQDGVVIHDSTDNAELAKSRDVRRAITEGLDHTGLTPEVFDRIYVDIGPGGLGATRTSVAFANAMGFATGRPVIGVPAFELLGYHVAHETGLPVFCARRAARPNLFCGIWQNGALHDFQYAHENAAADLLAGMRGAVALAGNVGFDRSGSRLDPMANSASMASFLALVSRPPYLEARSQRASPITEQL